MSEDPFLPKLILLAILILVNAFFAAAEIAVLSLSETKLRKQAEEGDKKAESLLKLTQTPDHFLSAIQIAITLAGFLSSAFAADSFSDPLVKWLVEKRGVTALDPAALNNLMVVLITLVLSYFSLVLGELVPKRIAMKKTDAVARFTLGPVSAVAAVFRPAVWLLSMTPLVRDSGVQDLLAPRESLGAGSIPGGAAAAMLPARLAVTGARGRYGVQYNEALLEEQFPPLGALLGDALASAGRPQPLEESRWRRLLGGDGIYFDFLGSVPLSALEYWLQGTGRGALAGSARRVLLCAGEGDQVLLCWQESDSGSFFSSSTALTQTLHLDPVTEGAVSNGAYFAFESAELADRLAPYTLVTEGAEAGDRYAASMPLPGAGQTAAVLEALSFSGSNHAPVNGGEVYPDGGDRLVVYDNGTVAYRAVHGGKYPVEPGPAGGVDGARTLAERTLGALCGAFVIAGLCRGPKPVLKKYWALLRTSGRVPSDYVRTFTPGPVLVNMGVNGLIATGYIVLTGGDLNGATIGAIFTIIGFSGYGKHAFNMVPVMAGVLLGSLTNHVDPNSSALQLAGLFGTTLAPFAGVFGWPFGVLAGLLHSSVVLQAGLPLEGMNLYNNGFSGGLVAIVLYPILTSLVKHRRPVLVEEDLYAMFDSDAPQPPEELLEKDREEE